MTQKVVIAIFMLAISVTLLPAEVDDRAAKLDKAIQDVISKREYQWRMPREPVNEKQQGLLFEFFDGLVKFTKRLWRPIANLYQKFKDWLRKQLSSLGPRSGSYKEWSKGELNRLIAVLIVLLSFVILFFVWRNWKRKKALAEIIHAEPVIPVPDLADENVVADQLPEDRWQRLAEDLISRGELRLALRAYFMATLAFLAQTHWITIAKFKSNREYWHELRRRAFDRQRMHEAFYQSVAAMDRAWYGMYPVTQESLRHFLENVETVKRAAA
jgi:Domain of unknown function (DUF4129)